MWDQCPTYLPLLSSSFKNLWPHMTLHHSLWADFSFSVVSQLSPSVLLENGFCTDLKPFLFKTSGETETQTVVSCHWRSSLTAQDHNLNPDLLILACRTFPSISHFFLLVLLELLPHHSCSAMILPLDKSSPVELCCDEFHFTVDWKEPWVS